MSILSGGQTDFFGLDIGPSSLQVVQLKNTPTGRVLDHYGTVAIDGNVSMSDSKADWPKLAAVIDQLVKSSGISTKNVAVGIPSNKVFTTVIDMDKLSQGDLAQTIRYQADSLIPTPLDVSKIDWAPLGPSPADPQKIEVLLSSVPNDYVEGRLDMLESIGLNSVAFEPNSFALVRALVPESTATTQMLLEVGNVSTDLVIVIAGVPRLTRSIPIGLSLIIRAASTALGVELPQAAQFVHKFGLGKDKLEGQVYNAIIGTVDNLMGEVDKSIKFFSSRYPNAKLERIIMTGGASTLPEFPLYTANRFGLNVEIGNAWGNVSFPQGTQNELLSVSYKFAVACGLAQRNQ